MKKHIQLLFSGVLFVTLILLSTSAQSAPANVTELRFANYFAPASKQAAAGAEFCKEIEKQTNGRVKITYFPGGGLLTAPRMYDGVVEGIADIGFGGMAYHKGKFPVTEIMDLPIGITSGWMMSHLVVDFYQNFKPKEWNDTHILWMSGSGPSFIQTRKPVYKLEDLKGLTIRAQGRAADIVSALGGTPRAVPMSEAYEGVAKGVINGFLLPFEALETFKLAEVLTHVTVGAEIGSAFTFYAVMNKNLWAKLPGDIQEIFNKVSKEFEDKYALLWNDIDINGAKYGLGKGIKLIHLSPEEVTKWTVALKPVIDAYIKEMVDAGFSKAEMEKNLAFVKERLAYWNKKQTELGIPFPSAPK
jgi:TRAP-type C4-dicarboxylate transport system substrate-binding protein